jgi:ABC-type phosphate transport system substrate-binding protein
MHSTVARTSFRAALGMVGMAAAAAFAPAQAQTITTIHGGGATLPSVTLGELFACYSGTTPRPAVCTTAVNSAVRFTYSSVGSGAGQRGWASQDPLRFTSTSTQTDVNFAVSEAALTSSQLNAFNNGGQFSSTGPTHIANTSDNCVSPATGTGADVAPSGGCYDNPRVENGPAIQIPLFGTPVTIAFDPVYKAVRNADGSVTEFRLNLRYPRADGSGGLRLTQALVCGIFSGAITQWNDAALTAANGGRALWPATADTNTTGNVGREIRVVVRDDDSGTSSLFIRWARANCAQWASATPAIPATGAIQTFPGNPTPGSISTTDQLSVCDNNGNNTFAGFGSRIFYGRGNEGVAFCINTPAPASAEGSVAVGGRIGYLSPDFALPAVSNLPTGNAFRGFALMTADVQNVANRFVAPTPAAVTTALAAITAPTGTARSNPLAWVSPPDAIIAGAPNPVTVPSGATAYPIVGTTNWLGYTCYSTSAKQRAISQARTGFLSWMYGSAAEVKTVIESNGFALLPSPFRSAIVANFLTGTAGTDLQIRTRTATTAALCTVGS